MKTEETERECSNKKANRLHVSPREIVMKKIDKYRQDRGGIDAGRVANDILHLVANGVLCYKDGTNFFDR